MPRLALLLLLVLACTPGWAADPMGFWDRQQRGANIVSEEPHRADFDAAVAAGVSWIRLSYDKWSTAGRDFLIGDADHYAGLVPEDLDRLRSILDEAEAAGLKVVLAPRTHPGLRWQDVNQDLKPDRLWTDPATWDAAAAFWRDLAGALRGHPAVVGYDLLNEPAPEHDLGIGDAAPGDIAPFVAWQDSAAGTPQDLRAFYIRMIAAIRAVDPDVPVVVDGGGYSSAAALAAWPAALADDRLLYAFHMYAPRAFTSGSNFRNKRGYRYPGPVPYGDDDKMAWDAAAIGRFLAPLYAWAARNALPPTRIVVGEFGCMRRNEGCDAYLRDLIAAFDGQGVHWAFFAFRDDTFDGYDYELGHRALDASYWAAVDQGKTPPPRPYVDNALWQAIKDGLRP